MTDSPEGAGAEAGGAHRRHPREHFPPTAIPEMLDEGTGLQSTPASLRRNQPCPPREKGGTWARAELAPSSSGGREGTRVLVPMEEGKVRANVLGCKQSCVFNKYYLYNYGCLGTFFSETEGDSLLRVTYFLWT